MKKTIFFVFLRLVSITDGPLMAQDTVKVQADTIAREKLHSPLFAGIASGILPGAGQVYNRKYWKVPIVYAGLATAGFFAYYNGNVYFTVKKNLDSQVAGDSTPEPRFLVLNNIFSKSTIDLNEFSYDDLILIEDEYRKYFTISIICGAAVYALNIIDAVVDAHLFYFDVTDDLSLQIRPGLFMYSSYQTAPALSLSLTFN